MQKPFTIRKAAALLALGITLAVNTAGCARADTAAVAATEQAALAKIIDSVGDFKAFRMKSAQFDALVSPYCKKTEHSADEYGVLAEYACKPGTGISQIKLDSRGEAGPGKSYIMLLVVDMPIDRYAPVREQLGKKLGKPAKGGKDYAYWPYQADKELSKNGNPVIMVSRDTADRTASFHIALEQGP